MRSSAAIYGPPCHCERSAAIHVFGLRGGCKWRAAHADKEAWIAASLLLLAMTEEFAVARRNNVAIMLWANEVFDRYKPDTLACAG